MVFLCRVAACYLMAAGWIVFRRPGVSRHRPRTSKIPSGSPHRNLRRGSQAARQGGRCTRVSQSSGPLTPDERQSLMWIAAVTSRVALPPAHIEKLLAGGYIHKGLVGRVLSDLGARLLAGEMGKKDPYE